MSARGAGIDGCTMQTSPFERSPARPRIPGRHRLSFRRRRPPGVALARGLRLVRLRRNALEPPAPDAPGGEPAGLCIACGKGIAASEGRVELDGVAFHPQCSIYRSWGSSAGTPNGYGFTENAAKRSTPGRRSVPSGVNWKR